MEDWISLLTLDSQTSSQVVSETVLKDISRGLKNTAALSRDSFAILVNALSEKLSCFQLKPIPSDLFSIVGYLCNHLANREDLTSSDVASFFSSFIEVILKFSPDSLASIFQQMLPTFHPKIIDPHCNVYIKYSILSGFNEISTFSSATKVELFLKQSVHKIYVSLASNLRALGDYDVQAQLLEFLLHVIPAARRRDFAENYLYRGLSDTFCSIIGQQFQLAARNFLNLINPIDPTTQSVFSVPCINVRVCDHDLRRRSLSSQFKNDSFWTDFNLVPERITTYCILPTRLDSSHDSEEGEETWETIAIHSELIEEVNVSSIRLEETSDVAKEQIVLSISTSEPCGDFARFWDFSCESDRTNEKSTVEFFFNPPDIVKALPKNTSGICCKNQSQQLVELLTGLRAYAEKMFPLSSTASSVYSQSSVGCQGQGKQAELGLKSGFGCSTSPLCLEIDESAIQSAPPPPPKSFFTDPDVSFEESAEGLGFQGIGTNNHRSCLNRVVKCQTARTPLSVRVGLNNSSDIGESFTFGAPSIRSVSSPFSVVTGLETPSPCSKPIETLDLDSVHATVDEDIASASTKITFPAGFQFPGELKSGCKVALQTLRPETDDKEKNKRLLKRATSMRNPTHPLEKGLRKEDTCDLDATSSSQSEDDIHQSQGSFAIAKKRIRKFFLSAKTDISAPEVFSQKDNVYSLDDISDTEAQQREAARTNLRTFEKFVDENGLELRSKERPTTSKIEEISVVDDIVSVLGTEALKPLRPCRRSGRLSDKVGKVEQTVITKDENYASESGNIDVNDDIEVLTENRDVKKNEVVRTRSPLLDSSTIPVDLSEEDLLVDEGCVKSKGSYISQHSNYDVVHKSVINQCPPVKNSSTPLEFTSSIQLESEKVDTACLIEAVSPLHTPSIVIMVTPNDKTVAKTLRRLSDESPERARRAAVPLNDENFIHRAHLIKVLSPQIEEDSFRQSGEIEPQRPKVGRAPTIAPINLDDTELTPQKLVPLPSQSSERAKFCGNACLSPIQRPPLSTRRRSYFQHRASVVTNTTCTTGGANSTIENSQIADQSAPSPMVISPFQRLEAAICALENHDKVSSDFYTSTNMQSSRRLCNTTAIYLPDESPCPNVENISIQECHPPTTGGLIVPAFGNKYFNIAAKTSTGKSLLEGEAFTTEGSTNQTSLRCQRRFFASSFAERNRREVEKRFFEVTRKKSMSMVSSKKKTTDAEKNQRKYTSKTMEEKDGNRSFQLSHLENSEKEDALNLPLIVATRDVAKRNNESPCRLQSRPAIRRAAAIARSRILKTSFNELDFVDLSNRSPSIPSPIPLTKSPAKAARTVDSNRKTAADENPSNKTNLDTSHLSNLRLFAPTPNTSGVFDLDLSEDDELEKDLRQSKLKMVKTVKDIPRDNASQPVVSTAFFADMGQCINLLLSTLSLMQSEFAKRLNQVKDEAEKLQRLLRWCQRSQSEEKKIRVDL